MINVRNSSLKRSYSLILAAEPNAPHHHHQQQQQQGWVV